MAATERSSVARACLVAVVLAGAGLGCGDSPEEGGGTDAWSGSVDTAADGRVTVANTGGGAWRQDTVRAGRTLLLGETGIAGGSEATTFGDIISLAVDSDGRMYVGDRVSNTVRAYGPDGGHLGLVGGEGSGPGEFRWPEALSVGPAGRLHVAETEGVTVMAAPPGGELPTEQVRSFSVVPMPQVYRPLRVTCRGRVMYPHETGRPDRHVYFRVDPDGTVLDTIAVPELPGVASTTPWIRTGPGGGRMVPGLDHLPLEPRPSWDVTPEGRLLVGESRRYRLLVVGDEADTVRVLGRSVERRPIPAPVRRESTSALRARLDSLPVAPEDVNDLPERVAEMELPSRHPAHLGVRVGEEGRLWVERPPTREAPDATPYDVFDRRGLYLGALVVPVRFDPGRGYGDARSRPRPVFTDDAVYGVVKDSVTGVQRVARFSYELPEREEGAPSPPPPACGEE